MSGDTNYNLIYLMSFWSWAELAAGIIISCLPAIHKFWQHIAPITGTFLKSRLLTRISGRDGQTECGYSLKGQRSRLGSLPLNLKTRPSILVRHSNIIRPQDAESGLQKPAIYSKHTEKVDCKSWDSIDAYDGEPPNES